MTKIFPVCEIIGGAFSPAKAEARTGLTLNHKSEPGQLGSIGKFKGKPLPYGAAALEVSSEEELVDKVRKHISVLRDCGAEDFTIHLYVEYESQCNLQFEPKFLQKVADLSIPLTITCERNE